MQPSWLMREIILFMSPISMLASPCGKITLLACKRGVQLGSQAILVSENATIAQWRHSSHDLRKMISLWMLASLQIVSNLRCIWLVNPGYIGQFLVKLKCIAKIKPSLNGWYGALSLHTFPALFLLCCGAMQLHLLSGCMYKSGSPTWPSGNNLFRHLSQQLKMVQLIF